MSDISISKPFELRFDILEVDDYLPSFKARICFRVEYFSSIFSFTAQELWFDCLHWKNFTDSLNALQDIKKEIQLTDLSNDFSLEISKEGDLYRLKASFFNSKVSNSRSNLAFQKNTSFEDLSPLREAFFEFPIWWE